MELSEVVRFTDWTINIAYQQISCQQYSWKVITLTKTEQIKLQVLATRLFTWRIVEYE